MGNGIITFKEYGKRSPLDARTCILAMLTVSVVMISGSLQGIEFYIRIGCCVLPFIFLIMLKRYMLASIYFTVVGLALLIEGALVQTGRGAIGLLVVVVSGLVTRFVVPMVMGYSIMASISVSEFITSMERMYVPSAITIPLSVMFRFFPTISEENLAISEMMKVRKSKTKRMGLLKRMEYQLVPVMMSTVRIADELSQASMTKGLGGSDKRTHICKVGFRVQDYVLILILGIMLILYTVY